MEAHVVLHPKALQALFTNKRETLRVFREIIGLFDIDHISIAYISERQELSFFSYTPSIEYHLIKWQLWQYDHAYQADFYQHQQNRLWAQLYHPRYIHELKYIKEQRNHLYHGFSISRPLATCYCIYSYATKSAHTRFTPSDPIFIDIGDYCTTRLLPLLAK